MMLMRNLLNLYAPSGLWDFWPYWGSGSRFQFTLIALVFSTGGVSYGASCGVPFLGGVLVKGWIDINKYGFLLRICKSITDLPGEEINSPHRGSYCSLLFLPATPLKQSPTLFRHCSPAQCPSIPSNLSLFVASWTTYTTRSGKPC